ncbi:T4 RnlA family RNA ligase [Candidatus Micrarchaeota archaeon]|nr:T4 RnlA family RNA ligase [Candidatus Micrarchaeota archaeon]
MADNLISELEKRVQNKLISKAVKGDLAIYCYTPKCVYDKKWDKYTKMARGLVVNLKTGEIVARPFPKFFNLNETEETKLENLPMKEPEITEKLDGSLGIFYYDKDEYFVTTKGTFYSEQGAWATIYFRERFSNLKIPEGLTLLFEIIYPENRIVIDYKGQKELFLIGTIDIKTGKDYDYSELQEIAKLYGFKIVPKKPLTIKQIRETIDTLPANEEGFVARYSNGLRIKIKGEEYLKIHRILSNLSLISIWEILRDNKFNKEFIEKIPEEFRGWTEKTAGILIKTKERIENEVKELYKKRPKAKERKEFALWVQKQEKSYHGLLFTMHDRDKEKMTDFIFKMIRPNSNRYQPIHNVAPEDKGEERLERIRDENL